MAKPRKKTEQAPRTGHRHVVTADQPRPAPNQSMAVGSVTPENPRPAPNQSAPAAGVVDADSPVPAAVQSRPVSTPVQASPVEEPAEVESPEPVSE